MILAVGLLDLDGVGHQRGGQRQGGLQKPGFGQQAQPRVGDQHQHFHAGHLHGVGVGNIVQPLDLGDSALLTHRAQQGGAGPLGIETEAELPRAANRLAGGIQQDHIGGAPLVPDSLQRQPHGGR